MTKTQWEWRKSEIPDTLTYDNISPKDGSLHGNQCKNCGSRTGTFNVKLSYIGEWDSEGDMEFISNLSVVAELINCSECGAPAKEPMVKTKKEVQVTDPHEAPIRL